MRQLHHDEEGIVAYHVLLGLLRLLIDKELLSGAEVRDLFKGAAGELAKDHRSIAKPLPELMAQLAVSLKDKDVT